MTPSEPTPEDILALARFCWPYAGWNMSVIGLASTNTTKAACPAYFSAGSRDAVAAAEAILIERGLGEEYGRAFAAEMRWTGKYWSPHLSANKDPLRLMGDAIAACLNAPLDARVRAMVAVVRAQEDKK